MFVGLFAVYASDMYQLLNDQKSYRNFFYLKERKKIAFGLAAWTAPAFCLGGRVGADGRAQGAKKSEPAQV